MDTEVVRTLLEIVNTGNFIRAAERLDVGQTTVSARIHLLEEQLGRPLFVRNKAGATLRPEGEQFLRHAPGRRDRRPGQSRPCRLRILRSITASASLTRAILAACGHEAAALALVWPIENGFTVPSSN
jgi:DNA-binding transcriptional LysR family regulator